MGGGLHEERLIESALGDEKEAPINSQTAILVIDSKERREMFKKKKNERSFSSPPGVAGSLCSLLVSTTKDPPWLLAFLKQSPREWAEGAGNNPQDLATAQLDE